jgi:periplasmic protein TonB
MTADAIKPLCASHEDPLGRIVEIGSRSSRNGLVFGLLAALFIHGAGAREAYLLTTGIGAWAASLRAAIHEHLWTNYEVEVLNPPALPPPPPAEEKPEEPAKVAKLPSPAKAEPSEPPPAAAQASKVLTREAAPDEPVDLTGNSFVTGNADTYAGGVTAASGTSTEAVRDLNATGNGVPGGKGKAKENVAAQEAPDLSTTPTLPPGRSWQCAFPPEADTDQIDFQVVPILVTVRPDGSAQSVKVISDPGHGFGRAARECALRQSYLPARDRQGRAVVGTTPPINVKFTR